MGLTVRKKKGSVDSGIIKHATRILTLSQKLQKWHLGNLQTSKYLVVGVRHRLHLRLQVGTWNRLQVCIFVCKSAKRPFWGVFFFWSSSLRFEKRPTSTYPSIIVSFTQERHLDLEIWRVNQEPSSRLRASWFFESPMPLSSSFNLDQLVFSL